MLSDRDIRRMIQCKELTIGVPVEGEGGKLEDLDDIQFQPVSIDLRLGDLGWHNSDSKFGLGQFRHTGFFMPAGKFMLGSTMEWMRLSSNLVGHVKGKSSVARRGLMVECAGLVDPGFEGDLTLELKNLTDGPIFLEYGSRICQLTLDWTSTTPERVYGGHGVNSHYQGQTGPTRARA